MAGHINLACPFFIITISFTFIMAVESSTDRITPHFISLTSTNYSAAGFVEIQPTFEVMLEQLAPVYAEVLTNYSYTSVFPVTPGTCNELEQYAHIQEMMSLYQNGQLAAKPTILLAAVCGLSTPIIADFGREMDFLVVTCHTEEGSIKNRKRFPTAVSFAGGGIDFYGEALIAILDKFSWTSIAVINDAFTIDPRMAKSREQCRGALEALEIRKKTISFLLIRTDLSRETPKRVLLEASKFSRIILSCTVHRPQRMLLAAAHDLDMTNGDYIFFHFYEMESPFDRPLVWQDNDDLDEKVEKALLNTFIVQSHPIEWNKIKSTVDAIQKRKFDLFGGWFPGRLHQEPNEFMVTCLEAIQASIININESCAISRENCISGNFLADQMLNRVFNLPLRPIRIGSQGLKIVEAVIQQLSSKDRQHKALFFFDSEVRKLRSDKENTITWMGGKAPPDRPLCGLEGQFCYTSNMEMVVGIAVGCSLAALVAFGVIFQVTRRTLFYTSTWWHIEPLEIHPRIIKLPERNVSI